MLYLETIATKEDHNLAINGTPEEKLELARLAAGLENYRPSSEASFYINFAFARDAEGNYYDNIAGKIIAVYTKEGDRHVVLEGGIALNVQPILDNLENLRR